MFHVSCFVKNTAFIIAVVVVSFSLSYIASAIWGEPGNPPPNCPAGSSGCDAPINVSGTEQRKQGGLKLGSNTAASYVDGEIAASKFVDTNNDSYFVAPANAGISAILNGNVGIGVTSPSTEKLEVGGNIYLSTGQPYIRFFNSTNSTNRYIHNWSNRTAFTFPDPAVAGLWVESAIGTTVIKLNRDGTGYFAGDVGIGNPGPNQKLDVAGNMTLQNNGKIGFNNDLSGQDRSIKLRSSYAGDQADAGTIVYRPAGWDAASLGIVGAGAIAGSRNVRAWDSFTVGYSTPSAGTSAAFAGNVGIGTSGPGEKLDVNGNVRANAFFYSSDERLKENIQIIENPLVKILKLDGVAFNWKNSGEKSVGFTAQNVEKVFPELVKTDSVGMKSVEYGNLVAPLIEAIKEQQKMIENQQRQIDELKALIK